MPAAIPWLNPPELEQTLAELLRVSADLRNRSVEHQPMWFPSLTTEDDLNRREKESGVTLPEDLRRFFLTVRTVDSDNMLNGDPIFWDDVCLIPAARNVLVEELGAVFLDRPLTKKRYRQLLSFLGEHDTLHLNIAMLLAAIEGQISQGWLDTRFLMIGQTYTGDAMLYCLEPPDHPSGTIIIDTHDDYSHSIVVVAQNMNEWLSRYIACDCREFALHGPDKWGIDATLVVLFIEDHLRLNPDDEGMKRWQLGQCVYCGFDMKRKGPSCPSCGVENEAYTQ